MEIMGEGGMVDELGIGVIRDSLSERVFPSFSTLYTRAKYFFITPYLIVDCGRRKDKRLAPRKWFDDNEVAVNDEIIDYYRDKPEESYFGKNKGFGKLKRQPSEIYWAGISQLGFVDKDLSLDRILDKTDRSKEELLSVRGDDGLTAEKGEGGGHSLVNTYSKNWREHIRNHGLALTVEEADFLRDRLKDKCGHGLPAELAADPALWDKYEKARKGATGPCEGRFVRFVKDSLDTVRDAKLKSNLKLACNFAIFIHGAHIAYNIALRLLCKESENGLLESLREQGREWFGRLGSEMIDYADFDIRDCLEGVQLKGCTGQFLSDYDRIVRNGSVWDAIEADLAGICKNQEKRNKKSKSRVKKLEEGKSVEDMDKREWIGLELIDYRYSATLTVIRDIYSSNSNTDEDAGC